MSDTQKYQQITKSPGCSVMKGQEDTNEMPRDNPDGSDDDMPLPQQGFMVIDQGMDSDGSSDDEGDQMQNGGYQLLSQEPEGPDDEEGEESMNQSNSQSQLPSAPTASATETPSTYDAAMLQQISSLSSSSTDTTSHPHLPQHLATLMPAQVPKPDESARVSYSDTKDVRESRMKHMAGDDQIKAAMAGLKLPSASAPQWANFVSEEDWKNNLVSTLTSGGKNARQSRTTQSKSAGSSKDSPTQDAAER